MIVLFQLVFFLVNFLLGLLFVALYPIIYLILHLKKYTAALHVKDFAIQSCILFHAASVGEVNALKPLLKAIQTRYPELQIVITTNTLAGLEVAKKIDNKIQCMLSPLDLLHLRLRQMKILKPRMICIVETEIWFNQIFAAGYYGIPIVFVNARLSIKSLKRYKLIKPLFKWLSDPIKVICAQSEQHRLRFRKLFDVPVMNCGNLKYAAELPLYNAFEARAEMKYEQDDFIICMGSSRPQEEDLIRSIYRLLANQIKGLKIILAIRHLNRINEVEKIFAGMPYSLESRSEPPQALHIIDTMGLLNKAYAICDIAIVGGSFFDFGGHNPLEPAFYAKPVIIGEYNRSCLDSVQKLNEQSAIVVSDAMHLAEDILKLYNDPELREKMGNTAKLVLTENASSRQSHLVQIEQVLEQANA